MFSRRWRSETVLCQRVYLAFVLLVGGTCGESWAGCINIDQGAQPNQANVPIRVELKNLTKSLSVSVISVESLTFIDTPVTQIKLAIRNGYLSGVTSFELLLPSGDKGRTVAGSDYFWSIDHPEGLQPEETMSKLVTIPANLPLTITVLGVLLADGGSDGEQAAISEMQSYRAGKIYQAKEASTILKAWLSDSGMNLMDRLLMMKNEMDNLPEESANGQGPRYVTGLQTQKTDLQEWIKSVIDRAADGKSLFDIENMIRIKLAALERSISMN